MSGTAKLHRYTGAAITVTYDAARCVHAGECTHGLSSVFDRGARPWVNADGAAAEAITTTVIRCPSGALRVERPDRVVELPPSINTATPAVDGPTYVRGDLVLIDADGNVALRDTRMALCRCGASRNKPFCDRNHRTAGFSDAGVLRAPDSPPATVGSGPLTIRARPNGPLMLTGSVTLVGANGRRAYSESTFLCRCGASGNKPYCDGTHKTIGFTA